MGVERERGCDELEIRVERERRESGRSGRVGSCRARKSSKFELRTMVPSHVQMYACDGVYVYVYMYENETTERE